MGTATNFNRLIYATLVLSLGLMANSACQAGLQEGYDAYDRGDYKTALEEFRILAEQGYAKAQYNLGFMYATGEGVAKDNTEAMKWFRKAAEQGYADAQYSLGIMYANGKGVPESFIQAYAWVNLAAAPGNKKAIELKELLRKQMSLGQIAEAQKLSRTFFERIYSKAAKRTPLLPSSTHDLILRTQEHLKALGYKPGPVDGILGDRTRQALRQYDVV